MLFEYMSHVQCDASIEIPDIGNCALIARSLIGEAHLMIVNTVMGTTEIFNCGPVRSDGMLDNYVSVTYRKMPYSDSKIKNAINKFVNIADVVYVEECTRDEVAKLFVNIAEFINHEQ